MLNEKIKSNLNKLDFDLKEIYKNVKFSEKTTPNKFYYQIEAIGCFDDLFQYSETREVKSFILIEKNSLNFDKITWKYSTNPDNPSAEFIERTSSIQNLAYDISETVNKKQMDINYLRSTPIHYEMINENKKNDFKPLTLEKKISTVLSKFEIRIEDALFEKENGRECLKLFHNGIKLSDKIKLESQLNNLDGIDFISYVDDYIKINYTKPLN